MGLRVFITRMFQRDNPDREEVRSDQTMFMIKLAQSLEKTDPVEFSCDEIYELLDQYVELLQSSEDAAELMPLVERHLDLCPDCREEYEALLNILMSQVS